VTTLALAIHKLLGAAPKVGSAIKAATSSRDLQERLEAAEAQNNRDVGQVCLAICRALVADGLGREPNGPEVTAFFEAAIGDPTFPARAHLFIGQMKKAASARRRAFLASMLFGLSFRSLPDDERDRVDMAVERMMPADVDLLVLIAIKDEEATRDRPSETLRYHFGTSFVGALLKDIELRLVTSDDIEDGRFTDEVTEADRFRADRGAFASLVSLGCLDLGESKVLLGEWRAHQLAITPLGRLVIRAIEEVRPGLDTPDPSEDLHVE